MPVMLPLSSVAGALEQARQRGEHRRRIALRRRRLADGEADLAPRHRDARDRVDHQQHFLALIAEILGDRRRDERAARAHERRLVAGRDDDHRARESFGAERVLDEVAHFAAALAEQRDDVDVGLRLARDHAEQRALADARAGEDADALAAADREQAVDRANARLERLGDDLALAADAAARPRAARAAACSSRPLPSIG